MWPAEEAGFCWFQQWYMIATPCAIVQEMVSLMAAEADH